MNPLIAPPPVRLLVCLVVFLVILSGCQTQPSRNITLSPDGNLAVAFRLTDTGEPRYTVTCKGRIVLEESCLGLVRDDTDFTSGLTIQDASDSERVDDRYVLLAGKRQQNVYAANRRVYRLVSPDGRPMEIVFQVSDDGLAFRYVFPGRSRARHTIDEEATTFRMPKGTRAWLQPMAEAKTGYAGTNPSYEEYYLRDRPVGEPSTYGAGWVFPALFRTGDTWIAITETGLDRTYAGTRLGYLSTEGEYVIAFPDPRETIGDQPARPASALPWQTPWRVIAVGSLETLVESSLGTDLANPAGPETDLERIRPGQSAWSWVLMGDAGTRYETQRAFIDYAADMNWEYVLIDAWWDRQIGEEKIRELIRYASDRGVGILLWYNSAGDWNTTPQTPRSELLTHESRLAEFERLATMGVAGLKIDFFGGDGQAFIAYYQDIIEDAARYGLLLNFHGCTIPRGWHRTYPHLMTMEAVRGMEFVTFEQANADRLPPHAAMLPFTRNLFDPMDFTPTAMHRINDRIDRRTTSGFELATAILFTSGIQHFAETPQGMSHAPASVRELLRGLPEIWDDVQFIAGFPGEFVVIARRADSQWFVAGINSTEQAMTLSLDFSDLELASHATGRLFTDAADGSSGIIMEWVEPDVLSGLSVEMPSCGGFVLQITE